MVRCLPLVLSFSQAHLCDTPSCNISRDSCAIPHKNNLVDVSDFFFFCSGRGKGESEAPGGGGCRFFIDNPRKRVFRRERGRGGGRVSAANRGILGGGGGLNIFFSGPKCPPRQARK